MKILDLTHQGTIPYSTYITSNLRDWSGSSIKILRAVFNGTTVEDEELNSSNYSVSSWEITDNVGNGQTMSMGHAVSTELKLKLMNCSTTAKSFILPGTYIKVLPKVSYDDGTDSGYITFSSKTFVVASVSMERTYSGAYSFELTCYDAIYFMTQTYVSSYVGSFPTVANMTSEVATAYNNHRKALVRKKYSSYNPDTHAYNATDLVGWSDNTVPSGFRSYTFEPQEGYTLRQQLGYCAGICGKWAYIDDNDCINFAWYYRKTNTDPVSSSMYTYQISNTEIYENGFNTDGEQHRILSVTTGTNSAQYTGGSGDNVNYENPYIGATEQSAAQAIVNLIASSISDSSMIPVFYTGKVKYRGNPLFNAGTIALCQDARPTGYGEWNYLYIVSRTIHFDGGWYEEIECSYDDEYAASYVIDSPTTQKLNRMQSFMEEAIASATTAVQQTEGSVFEFIEDTSDPDQVKNVGFRLYNETDLSENAIMATSGGIGFSTNGGESYDAAAIYFEEYPEDSGNYRGVINGNVVNVSNLNASNITSGTINASTVTITNIDGDNVSAPTDDTTGIGALIKAADDKGTAAQTRANQAYNYASDADTRARSATTKAENALDGLEERMAIADYCQENHTTYIAGGKIYTGSITASQIASRTITADKIVSNSITVNELASSTISAITAEVQESIVIGNVSGNYSTYIEGGELAIKYGGTVYGEIKANLGGNNAIGINAANNLNLCSGNTLQMQVNSSGVAFTSRPACLGSSVALLTDIPDLSGYATQTWVNNKGYITSSPSAIGCTGNITASGYISSGNYISASSNIISYADFKLKGSGTRGLYNGDSYIIVGVTSANNVVVGDANFSGNTNIQSSSGSSVGIFVGSTQKVNVASNQIDVYTNVNLSNGNNYMRMSSTNGTSSAMPGLMLHNGSHTGYFTMDSAGVPRFVIDGVTKTFTVT